VDATKEELLVGGNKSIVFIFEWLNGGCSSHCSDVTTSFQVSHVQEVLSDSLAICH